MTPDRTIAALAPILDRVRRTDYWLKPRGGSPSRRARPLTDGVLVNHCLGLHAIGACPIAQGASTTRLALLDLDSHKGETSWSAMREHAKRIIACAPVFGLRLIPFRSTGGRGVHLYALWDHPQDARSVRAHMADLLEACGLRDGAGNGGVAAGLAEVFPKQDSVPADGFGNMFVLPMSGLSVALDPETIGDIDLPDVNWPCSDEVPVLPPVERALVVAGQFSHSQDRVAAALFAIPNAAESGPDRDAWRNLMFAVHAATDGSDAGLAAFTEWSAQHPSFVSADDIAYQWGKVRGDRPGGITPDTLFAAARQAGWSDPAVAEMFAVAIANDHALSVSDMADIAGRVGAVATSNPFAAESVDPLPLYKGKVESTLSNAVLAVRQPPLVGARIRQDDFLGGEVQIDTGSGWRPLTDADYGWLRMALEKQGFGAVGADLIRSAVLVVADANRVDTGREQVGALPAWDGVDRVGAFCSRYLGAVNSPYTRAVSRYMWTALVGRVLDPGCQADMIPVLVGPQGAGKTQTIKAMLPALGYYAEVDVARKDSDQARLLRGKIIGEIAELKGLNSRAVEYIKAFVTRTHEEWTPKYREMNIQYARRCIFIGTTNEQEFLADDTGNRRWLPIVVGRCERDRVARDREQLWAQAVAMYAVDGIDWADAERLGKDAHAEHEVSDPWDSLVSDYVSQQGRDSVTTREVITLALGIVDARSIDKRVEQRAARALRRLGFESKNRRVNGAQARVWVRIFDASEVC